MSRSHLEPRNYARVSGYVSLKDAIQERNRQNPPSLRRLQRESCLVYCFVCFDNGHERHRSSQASSTALRGDGVCSSVTTENPRGVAHPFLSLARPLSLLTWTSTSLVTLDKNPSRLLADALITR